METPDHGLDFPDACARPINHHQKLAAGDLLFELPLPAVREANADLAQHPHAQVRAEERAAAEHWPGRWRTHRHDVREQAAEAARCQAANDRRDQVPLPRQADVVDAGLLNGPTLGNFGIVGGAPPVFEVAGTVTFTTKRGTLTVSLTESFDVSTGDFPTSGPVVVSTRKLSGATGSPMLDGTQDLSTGEFEEDITGAICVDWAP